MPMTASDKLGIKLRLLAKELVDIDARIKAETERVISPLAAKREAVAAKIAAFAPWPEDTPKDQREHAFIRWGGLGVLRRVWAKGKDTLNLAKLLKHVGAETITACTDTGPETTRVQFYPEREKASGHSESAA